MFYWVSLKGVANEETCIVGDPADATLPFDTTYFPTEEAAIADAKDFMGEHGAFLIIEQHLDDSITATYYAS